MERTRVSLLEKVRTSDNRAWEEFYAVYWAPILGYCRKIGLGDADAQDVLQASMMQLMRQLPTFQYDRSKGRFRNFLITIVHRQALKHFRKQKRLKEIALEVPAHADGQAPIDRLASTAEPEESPNLQAWQESLYLAAMEELRGNPRIKPDTLAAFREYVIEKQPAEEVASRYGLKVNALYAIRARTIEMLQKIVARLMQEADLVPPDA